MALTSPYQDNKQTPAQPTTVGFKISKPGYDASRTAGSNYVFNSSWPSLPIAFETTITNPITSSISTATIAHGLKYAPFAMVWAYGPDASGVGNVGTRFIPMMDTTNIYLSGGAASTAPFNATKLTIRAFALDLSRDIDYNLAPGDTFSTAYDPNFGVKVVKPGKNINSTDMRDFSIHSRCQSPLILAVKTEATIPAANLGTGIGNVIQYTNPFKYPVWAYAFVKLGSSLAHTNGVPVNTYMQALLYNQAYPELFSDGLLSYVGYTSGTNADNGATLVILRDPMFAATQQTVQY